MLAERVRQGRWLGSPAGCKWHGHVCSKRDDSDDGSHIGV